MTPTEIALARHGFQEISPTPRTGGELSREKRFAFDPSLRPLFRGEIATLDEPGPESARPASHNVRPADKQRTSARNDRLELVGHLVGRYNVGNVNARAITYEMAASADRAA